MKPRSIDNFLSNDRFFKEKSDTPPFRLNLTHKILCNPRREGKVPGKTPGESTSAIFDTLQWGIPNVFPGRFTNREIAVAAMRGEIKTGGLPKQATIFFSDIRGFTEKSENFTKAFGSEAPGRIIRWLNAYFTRMIECVIKTNGVVDKFIGDAVMAHWGTAYTAGSPEKDAFNCVKAAPYDAPRP